MFEIYERYLVSKTENENENKNLNGKTSSMPFRTFIDDICYKKTKTLNIFSIPIREIKERAYTYTPTNNVPLENWRNKGSIQSTILNNNTCKNLQSNKINEYNNNKKNMQVNN
jgi:hypothetical protein